MSSTGFTCIRKSFCWLNILILLCGCAFLGAGVWLRVANRGYATLLPDHAALSADSLFITVGALSVVLTFFGCCGSWFQSRCMLVVYFALIVLLFLSEFLIGSLVFVFRGGLARILVAELRDGLEHHYNVTDRGSLAAPSVATIWDALQTNMHCCGVRTYEDWYDIDAWSGERWVPTSCCRTIVNQTAAALMSAVNVEGSGAGGEYASLSTDCGRSHNPAQWWDRGCADVLYVWLVRRLCVVGTVALVIAFLQLSGLITSMLLFCTMKRKNESHTYKSYSPQIDPSQRQPQRSTSSFIDE